MPFRKSHAKRRAVRRPRRQHRKRGARSVVQVGRQITSRRNFCKLTYEIGQVGTTTTSVLGSYALQLNSVHDPQYSVGGGQPRGFDQWSAFYENYRVHGVKVTVYAQSLTPDNQSILALSPRTVVGSPVNVKELLEQPATRRCFFTSDRPCIKSAYFDCAKALGITRRNYNTDDAYNSGVGASPAQLLLCYINWININETTSTGHNIRATATYYVEFYKPLTLGSS